MDERLEKALDFSNYMVTLNNQKRLLAEQFDQDIIYYTRGGQFTVTQELISFCHTLFASEQTVAVLIDDNNIPIEIESLEHFLSEINSIYFEASNKYLNEYSKLKKNRSVEGIIG
jgi:hypothetical protein